MGLGNNAKECDFGDNDLADDGGGCDSRDGVDGSASVACSICLETVADNGDRSWAKLQCGHQFHLDCIGSAFNAKGMMQCPNCRKIEKGQWLYANGCRSFPDFNNEDWTHEEEIYDLAYSEMSFGVHWCPFGSLARLPSFENGEFSPSSYNDLLGQHGFFSEPTMASSAGHSCPYIAYFSPVHASSSSSGSDSSSFSSHWNSGSSVAGGVPMPYCYPAVDPHYYSWDYHTSPPPPPPFSGSGAHIGSPPQPTALRMGPRTSRASLDMIRPRPPPPARPPHYMRPFLGHSSDRRDLSYPGSSVRSRDRVQALQAYNRPLSDTTAAVYQSGRRGIASVTASSSAPVGGGGGFVRFNIWERDQSLQPQSVTLNQMERDTSCWTTAAGSFHDLRHGGGSSSS
ncbi:PREDICTED: uncharacterized protein LOC104802795 [Tarenaya hassleriana]|uniref:uncharacterized protein LOC104802795 n=1 Tax=Tarenaya hassleriana TaxID=28532 RepID=UPI00053C6BED|nr:PREDICTED: uncharacterized protein LOC104802795 [Tarenaya hassleriana]